ncbi:MAG: hypothetical protein GX465_16915 [Acidobacteria bacterium]|nr:hypothetical protein [Acidobacteriota bacterium]
MPKKDVDFSEADFKKEVNKILKSMDVPLDPDGNYPEEVKELWPAIQSKLGKKLLAKNWRVWTTMWTNVIGPTYVSAAKEAAKYAGVKYKGEIGAFAKKYHRDHGLQLCKTLTETDLQRVQDQIVDNWGIGEKAFEKKFQDDYIGSEARLKTIYRSEHARAISEGTLEVGQEVGHQYKQWWCAEDERSCEICMAHHEEVVPMDEAFSGGFAIPQDSHPSCRCVLITLEESDLSDDQKARMASRDPISLDDLDPTFQNSPWKSNEAFRQVLNYKCPEGSHGPGFSCGGEGPAEKSDIKSLKNQTSKKISINPKLNDTALEKIGKQYDSATMGSSRQDMRLNRMAKLVGFDGKPKIVSEVELEQYTKENKLDIMYRGVSSSEHAEQFKTGEYWAGKGLNGNGTYAAYGSEGKSLAKKYAPSEMGDITFDDCIIKMCMTKDAKIINYDDLISKIPKVLKMFPKAKTYIGSDEGKIATILGYDAIRLPPEDNDAYKEGSWGNVIILNRSKVMVVK